MVSWNVAYRVGAAAVLQGEWLAALRPAPDIVLLQEVNPNSVDALCAAAGLTWCRLAVDVRMPEAGDRPVRRRGVAIAGAGPEPTQAFLLEGLPLPERTLIAPLRVAGIDVQVATYHAPPGVSWFEEKPRQAVVFARWLAAVSGPVLFGADANTPLVDAINFADSRTHWHTGDRRLHGAPGDDVLVGPGKIHDLDDALRRWLSDRPAEVAELLVSHPNGPLRVSHRTGNRRASPGTGRRFDSIWVSRHFSVVQVDYPYAGCIATGSDHSAVVADVIVRSSTAASADPCGFQTANHGLTT